MIVSTAQRERTVLGIEAVGGFKVALDDRVGIAVYGGGRFEPMQAAYNVLVERQAILGIEARLLAKQYRELRRGLPDDEAAMAAFTADCRRREQEAIAALNRAVPKPDKPFPVP